MPLYPKIGSMFSLKYACVLGSEGYPLPLPPPSGRSSSAPSSRLRLMLLQVLAFMEFFTGGLRLPL